MRNIDSLKNTSQFREVYENGRSQANGILVLYVLATGGDRKRLGISVSKKIGNSVVRHRITRIIRESFLKLKDEIPEGYTLVVIARTGAREKGFSEICDALQHLMYKTKLIDNPPKV